MIIDEYIMIRRVKRGGGEGGEGWCVIGRVGAELPRGR